MSGEVSRWVRRGEGLRVSQTEGWVVVGTRGPLDRKKDRESPELLKRNEKEDGSYKRGGGLEVFRAGNRKSQWRRRFGRTCGSDSTEGVCKQCLGQRSTLEYRTKVLYKDILVSGMDRNERRHDGH